MSDYGLLKLANDPAVGQAIARRMIRHGGYAGLAGGLLTGLSAAYNAPRNADGTDPSLGQRLWQGTKGFAVGGTISGLAGAGHGYFSGHAAK